MHKDFLSKKNYDSKESLQYAMNAAKQILDRDVEKYKSNDSEREKELLLKKKAEQTSYFHAEETSEQIKEKLEIASLQNKAYSNLSKNTPIKDVLDKVLNEKLEKTETKNNNKKEENKETNQSMDSLVDDIFK